ncbi:SOS response-associated peptidase family protein [Rhodococcus erythropolis]
MPDEDVEGAVGGDPVAKRRVIIPAAGYYEWIATDAGKTPFFLRGESDVIAMAGLYELWSDPELHEDDLNRWAWTCTVRTRPASDAAGYVHERSPMVLPEPFWRRWLDPNSTDMGEVKAMIDSVPEPHLEPFGVSNAVNSLECGQQSREHRPESARAG